MFFTFNNKSKLWIKLVQYFLPSLNFFRQNCILASNSYLIIALSLKLLINQTLAQQRRLIIFFIFYFKMSFLNKVLIVWDEQGEILKLEKVKYSFFFKFIFSFCMHQKFVKKAWRDCRRNFKLDPSSKETMSDSQGYSFFV